MNEVDSETTIGSSSATKDSILKEVKAKQKEMSVRNLKRITEYCQLHDLTIRKETINNISVLVIQDPLIEKSNFHTIISKLPKNILSTVLNNCEYIAQVVVKECDFDFIVEGDKTRKILYKLHYLPIKQTADTAMCLDVNAGHGVDFDQGGFDVLFLHLKAQEDIFNFLQENYGGTWRDKY